MVDQGSGEQSSTAVPIWPALFGSEFRWRLRRRRTLRGLRRYGARSARAVSSLPCSGPDGSGQIGRRGVLYNATVIHQGPEGFSAPYRVGYVDVESGVRVFAHMDNGSRRPQLDQPISLAIATLRTARGGSRLRHWRCARSASSASVWPPSTSTMACRSSVWSGKQRWRRLPMAALNSAISALSMRHIFIRARCSANV
ncbi:MAG: OB-fold domain-containing protein [Alphaproteobacteria bacterium]|nr:OB-fold domain-containing protein [Alphaproteobacteria bacterium]